MDPIILRKIKKFLKLLAMLLTSANRGLDWSLLEDDIDFPASDDDGCSKIYFRSTKRSKIISTNQLPEDMVYEILLRLPVMPLIRFRCVSKGVCGMIDSPIFVKKRNHHHQCKAGSLSSASASASASASDYAVIIQDHRWFSSLNFSDDLKRANRVKLDPISPLDVCFVACCNGIFCFWEFRKEESYILWNPSNGTTKKVRCHNLPPLDATAISIGYDSVNDDYKITRSEISKDIDIAKTFQVYSLRKGSWKSFHGKYPPGYPYPYRMRMSFSFISFSKPGICVSSAMHWLWKNPTDSSSRFIAVFDLVSESFRSLPLPEKPTGLGMKPVDLTDFGGRLCVTFDLPSLDHVVAPTVWVMENYGCERSWTPLYSYTGERISRHHNTNHHNTNYEYSYFPNKKKRLLCNNRRLSLSWWDPHKNSFKKIKVEGRPKLCHYHRHFSYIRNLVRLDKKLI